MMFEKYLQEIGLSDKEALVYVTLVQSEHLSVIDIAKKTKINRTTVYLVLESMQKKGLISETRVGKKVHYEAAPPERLETYIERQKIVLDERAKMLKDIIPQIKSIQRESGERPVVKYFEGKEGIISSTEELFSASHENSIVYLLYPKELVEEIFSEKERAKYRQLRISKKIRSKSVYASTGGTVKEDGTGDRVAIDMSKYPISCDISIYDDRVRIHTLGKKLTGIFIENKDVADTLRSIIDLIHDCAKKKPQE